MPEGTSLGVWMRSGAELEGEREEGLDWLTGVQERGLSGEGGHGEGWLAGGGSSASLPAGWFSTGAAVFSRREHSHGSVIILTGCRENTHEELRRCASNHVARLNTFFLSLLFFSFVHQEVTSR